MQRMRAELNRLAQDRDSYKQKYEAMHRAYQQQQQQQQQKNLNGGGGSRQTVQLSDASPNYYL